MRLSRRQQAAGLVLAALLLRLLLLAAQGAAVTDPGSDDGPWYIQNGIDLLHAAEAGPLSSGPLYMLVVGFIANAVSYRGAIVLIKLVQILLGALLVLWVYLLGRRYAGHRAGMIAGAGVGLGLAFILDNLVVATETLGMCLLFAALWAWRPGQDRSAALAGLLLGLAALTRPVLLLFPAALVLHMVLGLGLRASIKPALYLLLVFALVLLPWTVYNAVRWDRLVIAGEGFSSFLFYGAQPEGWTGPEASDAAMGVTADNLDGRDFGGRALASITADPLGWLGLRLRNLGEALLQPYHTAYFPGESLKALAQRWLMDAEARDLEGLGRLVAGDAFWPKLLLYIWHGAALLGGLWGMLRTRCCWRRVWPIYMVVAYFLAVHMVLLALPRYLFPMMPALWLFVGAALGERCASVDETSGSFW